MSPKQKKLAAKAPPPNKLDEKDFKVLREEKAKGRGMGLQDEKVQPGKVIKAKDNKFIERRKILSNMSEFQKRRLKLESKKIGGVMKARKGKSAMVPLKKGYSKTLGVFPTINKVKPSVGGSGSGMGKGTDKVSTKKAEDFMKRRKQLGGAGKVISATKIGKMLLPVVGAGVAAQQYLKSKMKKKNKNKDPEKKMGGGMMQKPMGYKSGMGPAGAAGPSAGRPGGRRPMQKGPKGGIGSMPKKRDGIEIIVMTKDGPKRITRSELDGMSAIEQKMGGGMMKARRGRIVDDQKRDKRNPNRKPSTKKKKKSRDI